MLRSLHPQHFNSLQCRRLNSLNQHLALDRSMINKRKQMPLVLRQHLPFPACHRCLTTLRLLVSQLHFPMLTHYRTLVCHQLSTQLQLLRRPPVVNHRHSSGNKQPLHNKVVSTVNSKQCFNKDHRALGSILQMQITTMLSKVNRRPCHPLPVHRRPLSIRRMLPRHPWLISNPMVAMHHRTHTTIPCNNIPKRLRTLTIFYFYGFLLC